MAEEEILVPAGKRQERRLAALDRLNISVGEAGELKLTILRTDDLAEAALTAKLAAKARMSVVFADFSKFPYRLTSRVDLIGEGSACDWRLASLAGGDAKKDFDVSFVHAGPNSNALMDNYGVAKDKASIRFLGVNHILKEAHGSNTRQSAKIIVLDHSAFGSASPSLRIDNNDVMASHAVVVGEMSEEHMFYLMSRGLTRAEARRLITIGYLKPISRDFDEADRKIIMQAIEEAL